MGTPTICVLVPECITMAQRTELEQLFHALARNVEYTESWDGKNRHAEWELRDFKGPLIGISPEELGQAGVTISIFDMSEYEPNEEGPQFEAAIGDFPAQCLLCSAAGRKVFDHRLLGNITLQAGSAAGCSAWWTR